MKNKYNSHNLSGNPNYCGFLRMVTRNHSSRFHLNPVFMSLDISDDAQGRNRHINSYAIMEI